MLATRITHIRRSGIEARKSDRHIGCLAPLRARQRRTRDADVLDLTSLRDETSH